jgi:hypothetical protein
MSSDILQAGIERSSDSERFERVLLKSRYPGVLPRLSSIDFQQISDLMPWVTLIRPDAVERTLKITMAGCGFTEMQGHSLIDMDYLDFVDPSIKGDAFDSTFIMLTRPCGLWQISPVTYFDDGEGLLELTGVPVFDSVRGCGLVAFLMRRHTHSNSSRIMTVKSSTEWSWIEMKR